MAWIAGADGCKAGWYRVSRSTDSGLLRFDVLQRASELLSTPPVPEIVTLDIPIGLPDAGQRLCDQKARRLLGIRRNSVFPAPIRSALEAQSRGDASQITEAKDGRKVSAQGWAIFRKVREVDELLQSNTDARLKLYEVHPELCFWAWAGERPMSYSKKKTPGRHERHVLACRWLGVDPLDIGRSAWRRKQLADDDILDAVAALWTATRISEGVARSLPSDPPRDSTDLPMRIIY